MTWRFGFFVLFAFIIIIIIMMMIIEPFFFSFVIDFYFLSFNFPLSYIFIRIWKWNKKKKIFCCRRRLCFFSRFINMIRVKIKKYLCLSNKHISWSSSSSSNFRCYLFVCLVVVVLIIPSSNFDFDSIGYCPIGCLFVCLFVWICVCMYYILNDLWTMPTIIKCTFYKHTNKDRPYKFIRCFYLLRLLLLWLHNSFIIIFVFVNVVP